MGRIFWLLFFVYFESTINWLHYSYTTNETEYDDYKQVWNYVRRSCYGLLQSAISAFVCNWEM